MKTIPTVGMFDDNHRYYWNGQGPMASVTGILKLQDALLGDGLTTWAAGIASDHVLHEWATVPDRLDSSHVSDEIKAEALAKVNAARDIGSAVHGQISDILLGLAATPTERTAPYLYGFTSFLATERPEFVHSEEVVLSPSHGFAGRFDFAARIHNRMALVDVKTGKQKASHRLQLAGYASADFIGRPDDAIEHPIPRFRDYYVLLLREGTYELVPLTVTRADRRHFLDLTRTYAKAKAWAA